MIVAKSRQYLMEKKFACCIYVNQTNRKFINCGGFWVAEKEESKDGPKGQLVASGTIYFDYTM